MKKLALLIALVSAPAFALGPQTFGHNVTLRNATIQSLDKKGTIDVPAGKDLVVTHAMWGAVSNSAIAKVEIVEGKATLTTTQLHAPPPGAIGWGGTVKNTLKADGLSSYAVKFTNGMGQSATVKVNTTLMNVDPVLAK